MTPAEIQVKIHLAQQEAGYWQSLLTNKSCRSCKHFDDGLTCGLTDRIEPPAEVKKTGCPQWVWDSIPF